MKKGDQKYLDSKAYELFVYRYSTSGTSVYYWQLEKCEWSSQHLSTCCLWCDVWLLLTWQFRLFWKFLHLWVYFFFVTILQCPRTCQMFKRHWSSPYSCGNEKKITLSFLQIWLFVPYNMVCKRSLIYQVNKLPGNLSSTPPWRKKRVAFPKKYLHWTEYDWLKVMFSNESTFKCIRGTSGRVRQPSNFSRYDLRYDMRTVTHSDQVMVWGAFSGAHEGGGLYF